MFDVLFGNATISKVLLYLARYEEGYARQIARHFSIPVNMVQKQLEKLEPVGILKSRLIGRTRLYQWNETYPLRKELLHMLKKALDLIPQKEVSKYFK